MNLLSSTLPPLNEAMRPTPQPFRAQHHTGHRLKEQKMSTAIAQSNHPRRFSVRDLSERYDSPTFDIIFHDRENGVERYSEAIWTSPEQAAIEAKRLDEAQLRPVHWDIYREK
ncbi:hypothetical protein SAMN04244579_04648 [Azotobacter beijerinckii]|uniref:Uncharacterized protein n=1 Tax=Azotobacter beijerinckii TaxID=170623 RepID=A0A1H6ZCY7_9GAMM|nr:hypothetical protein [Azotobacter beijerinckii]SEJ51289.1 hypothetical protein SAMN04244579_04648 [Azotobacter beijerinckii]